MAPGQDTGTFSSAFDINTSGVHIDLGLIEDNEAVGLRGYMIDSSTIINRLDMMRNGNPRLCPLTMTGWNVSPKCKLGSNCE